MNKEHSEGQSSASSATAGLWTMIGVFALSAFLSCSNPKEHTAPAVLEKDSVSMMTSYGVNTLISDSGVMKYRIVAERWAVNTVMNPPRWIFHKGLFLEQFDDKFNVSLYVTADTAYFYNEEKLWELRGRVHVRNTEGLIFDSQELFWDQVKHELYSNMFSHLVTPERDMQGTYFRSDEQMRRYFITNSKGSFVRSDVSNEEEDKNEESSNAPVYVRPQDKPHRKRAN